MLDLFFLPLNLSSITAPRVADSQHSGAQQWPQATEHSEQLLQHACGQRGCCCRRSCSGMCICVFFAMLCLLHWSETHTYNFSLLLSASICTIFNSTAVLLSVQTASSSAVAAPRMLSAGADRPVKSILAGDNNSNNNSNRQVCVNVLVDISLTTTSQVFWQVI